MKVKPKKSLGQNFLIDKNILEKISNSTQFEKDSTIIEIGPGTGNLTEFLLKKNPKKIILIEKDNSLVKLLKNKFLNNVEIINEDILKINKNNFLNEKLIIFGNLPYNISSQILAKLIINNENLNYQKLVFMFQKELADRILSNVNSKNYGRLSILSNWRFDIKKILDINPNSFYPKPKIKSTLLLFTPKKNIFKFKDPKNLEYVTRIFFNQKRKKIKKPLIILFGKKLDLLNKIDLDVDLRPQNISTDKYFEIVKEFEKLTQ